MNVLLLTSHAIAEYDDLRMLTDLGYDVFSIGGAYGDVPFEGKRPPLDVTRYPDLEAACDDQRAYMSSIYGDPGPNIDWTKARLADAVIDWADVIIVHHFPESWIYGQWDNINRKRVIWRTCGQSSPDGSLERLMAPLRTQGLEVVRYSPKERNLPDYAGEDALIRFGKYPSDYGPWVGYSKVVGNVTQHMAQRGSACGYGFWLAATEGLPTLPAGPGSEEMGGLGSLGYYEMLDYLISLRVYLYTGTQPASYTLGLMEAMLTGTPVVSINGDAFGWPDLFEGDDIVGWNSAPLEVVGSLGQIAQNTRGLLADALFGADDKAINHSVEMRKRALELFDVAVVGPQWKAFLG